jgi:hypothetical protein
MRTSPIAILLFAVAAFLGALGQFFYKSGADQTNGSLRSYLLNARLFAGVICYVAVMALFVAAFKKGGALTVLYPVYASTFIWAALIAWLAYGTALTSYFRKGRAPATEKWGISNPAWAGWSRKQIFPSWRAICAGRLTPCRHLEAFRGGKKSRLV